MRVALVTGGGSGIGRACAEALSRDGAFVVVGDIDAAGAAETVARCGGGAALRCDVTARADVEALVARGAETGTIDTVIASAGIFRVTPLAQLTDQDVAAHLAVNTTANIVLARAAAPLMGSGGAIVLIASLGGLRGTGGSVAYNTSKGAVVNLTRALCDELGPAGIRVNCLCPGWIDTPFNDTFWAAAAPGARDRIEGQIPLRRQGTPAEVAGAAVFLASPAAAYITGQPIVIDGGLSAT